MRFREIVPESSQQRVRKASERKAAGLRRLSDANAAADDALATAGSMPPGPSRTERVNAAGRKKATAARTYQSVLTSANASMRSALADST
jgi:hypothetical protein